MWIADFGLFVFIYASSLLWQLVSVPFLRRFTSELVDGGWAAGRVFSSVLVAVIIFTVASLGVPINTNSGLMMVFALLATYSFFIYQRDKTKIRKFFVEKRRMIFWEEILLFIGIVFMGTMRGFGPDLNSLEKYMDYGFIFQYLLNVKLPVSDMWFAGDPINYYSFGHFWSSIMIRSWGVAPAIGFNLMLAFSFGLNLAIAFSVTANLLKGASMIKMWFGGILSAGLVMFGGNSHILWWMVKNLGLTQAEGSVPYWYGVATRFIPQTIHEFPSYTFTIGDLHAHLIDLPIVLTFLMVFVLWGRKTVSGNATRGLEIVMGCLLGVMVMTNTWDAMVYSLLMLIFVAFAIAKERKRWRSLVRSGVVTACVGIATSFIWWRSFNQITQGLAWVTENSAFWDLMIVWGGQILFGAVAVLMTRRNMVVTAMVMTAVALILIPEIFFFKDIYPDHPRANTMFKLTYQSFVMLSLMGGVVIIKMLDKKAWLWGGVIGIVCAGLLVYPFTSYTNFYTSFSMYHGLDGEIWLKDGVADKYGAIMHLKKNRDGRTLLEYPGKSFSLSNASSVFSGVPAVLGWREHEWLWRSSGERMYKRVNEIKTLYESPESDEAMEIINKYNLGWIIVGIDERENYQINHLGIQKLGRKVWEEGQNYLLQIK